MTAALALSQAGIAVRIIDRLATPTNQSRAAVVHARTLEMWERLGIVEDFLDKGVRVSGVSIYGHENTQLASMHLNHLPTAYPFMLGLEQFETEAILTRRLSALGVEVDRGWEFVDLGQSDSVVDVTIRSADGSEQKRSHAYVLGADGGRSGVRASLKLPMEGDTMDATWITADVRIAWDRPGDEAIAYLGRGGFAFIAPMNDDRWRVIINLHHMTREEAESVTLDDIQKIVEERFGISTPFYDPVWISPFSINTRMTPRMREGRVFLAGDAAHVHSPVGGQGMNTGIQDALNLAWKLALVIKGQAGDSLLESYNTERHENALRLVRFVGPATRALNLSSPIPVEMRNLAMRMLSQLGLSPRLAMNFSMLEVEYPDSPIVEEDRETAKHPDFGFLSARIGFDFGPSAGERAPDAEGIHGENGRRLRLHELWRGDGRHQLLLFEGENENASAAEAAALQSLASFLNVIRIAKSPNSKGAIFDPDGNAHGAYGVRNGACYLIRPDGYVAYRSLRSDANLLRAYLDKWFILPEA